MSWRTLLYAYYRGHMSLSALHADQRRLLLLLQLLSLADNDVNVAL